MNKKPVIAFVIGDNAHADEVKKFTNSLRKWHTEEELPLSHVNQEWLNTIKDPAKFYKMTPLIAKDLMDKYDTVIKFDSDQIITGKLNHLWENADFDIGCVLNGNPAEPPYTVWDIPPAAYMNCGLVVMRNKQFVDHWMNLCNSYHFNAYQFREQDLMNIMFHYGEYKLRCFDWSENWHGLVSKGFWQYCEVKDNQLILPKGDRPWPHDGDKIIKVIHFAGGNDPNKGNYRIRFQPDAVKWLDNLVK